MLLRCHKIWHIMKVLHKFLFFRVFVGLIITICIILIISPIIILIISSSFEQHCAVESPCIQDSSSAAFRWNYLICNLYCRRHGSYLGYNFATKFASFSPQFQNLLSFFLPVLSRALWILVLGFSWKLSVKSFWIKVLPNDHLPPCSFEDTGLPLRICNINFSNCRTCNVEQFWIIFGKYPTIYKGTLPRTK